MRRLALTVFLVGAGLFMRWSGNDLTTSVCRSLTTAEAAGIRAGAFHYCSWTMPIGFGCSTCTASIYTYDRVMMPGMPPMPFKLYYKCSTTPTINACWQIPISNTPPGPTPTCNLNPAACTGLMDFFWQSDCTGKLLASDDPPYEACSLLYSAGYMAGTPGTVSGVNCEAMPMPPVMFMN